RRYGRRGNFRTRGVTTSRSVLLSITRADKGDAIIATTTVSQSVVRGGGFLTAPMVPAEIFTPADVTDDQRLVGQTAAEFVTKEVLPLIPDLEKHKEGLMPQL